jgi:hypothetical protein
MSIVIQGIDLGPALEFFGFLRELGSELNLIPNAGDNYGLLLNLLHVEDWKVTQEMKDQLARGAAAALRECPGMTEHSKWILNQLVEAGK